MHLIYLPCFQKFPDCGQPTSHTLDEVFLIVVLNIVSTSVIIHAKASLFQNDLCSTISFQMPSKYTIYRPCFHFSAVPNRLKCLQNEPVFIFFFYSFRLYRMLSEGIILRPCYRQNAPFTVIIIKFFSAVSKCSFYRLYF